MLKFLATLKAYVEAHAATLEAEGAAVLHRFHDVVIGDVAKLEGYAAELRAKHYTVIAPGEAAAAAPAPPIAAPAAVPTPATPQ